MTTISCGVESLHRCENTNIKQSAGCNPKTPNHNTTTANKRTSGLFSFLRWFRPFANRDFLQTDSTISSSTSCDSLNSIGTVASFSFVPVCTYTNEIVADQNRRPARFIRAGPETETYRARLRERDKRRESDRLITLRRKYNLFFWQTSPLSPNPPPPEEGEETTHSLPAPMTRTDQKTQQHRRTNSENCKNRHSGSYVHVKGKRRAPPPPINSSSASSQNTSTLSLRRRKRLAPIPPSASPFANSTNSIASISKEPESLCKSTAYHSPQVSPWYKRNHKYESIEETTRRKSGICYLTNISDLDREASELVQKKSPSNECAPHFMRPKDPTSSSDESTLPKRRSAKDLIAKFNAITGVNKVTVFGASNRQIKQEYFGLTGSPASKQKQQQNLELHRKRIEDLDTKRGCQKTVLTDSVIQEETSPKIEKKNWNCPKCFAQNDYWRIICHVCSAIKPYFDEFTTAPISTNPQDNKKISGPSSSSNAPLERSRTQIAFPIPKKQTNTIKGNIRVEEREQVKKMLIEMKNSLPKKKTEISMKQNNYSRSSVIVEVNETLDQHESKTNSNKFDANQEVQPLNVTRANFEPMRVKDFEEIYEANGSSVARIYANITQNSDLSIVFNLPDSLRAIKSDKRTDTIEVNRLLRKLETSIAKGQLGDAASYAKELAQLKVNCSMIRQKPVPFKKQGFSVEMFVEDKVSHRGPISIDVTSKQTVGELKAQIARDFQIPINVQRWILGKQLAGDEASTLEQHGIKTEGSPIFLYLVAPEQSENDRIGTVDTSRPSCSRALDAEPELIPHLSNGDYAGPKIVEFVPKQDDNLSDHNDDINEIVIASDEWECHLCTLLNPNTSNICDICATVRQKPVANNEKHTYLQLVDLDNDDLVENRDDFECVICLNHIEMRAGVTLRECLHQFCKECLAQTIEHCEEAEIQCPYRDKQYACQIALQDREIKALVKPDIYEQHLAKSVALAENKSGNLAFHCKTPDCRGWCIFEDNVNEFLCPVCSKVNCLTCQAIHGGVNCKQYQEQMRKASAIDENARRTQDFLEEMVHRGDALICPTCQVILMKKWGCDWLRCSVCKTEICWVTRGLRWGPAGKGDTSAGCKCGVNGIKCHPKCTYCH